MQQPPKSSVGQICPMVAALSPSPGALSYNLLVERVIRMREIEEQQGAEGNQVFVQLL